MLALLLISVKMHFRGQIMFHQESISLITFFFPFNTNIGSAEQVNVNNKLLLDRQEVEYKAGNVFADRFI
jgi:hypothetical protein